MFSRGSVWPMFCWICLDSQPPNPPPFSAMRRETAGHCLVELSGRAGPPRNASACAAHHECAWLWPTPKWMIMSPRAHTCAQATWQASHTTACIQERRTQQRNIPASASNTATRHCIIVCVPRPLVQRFCLLARDETLAKWRRPHTPPWEKSFSFKIMP